MLQQAPTTTYAIFSHSAATPIASPKSQFSDDSQMHMSFGKNKKVPISRMLITQVTFPEISSRSKSTRSNIATFQNT